MAAVLANWGGYYRQKDYIQETIRTGLDVRPPHINYSMREFAVGDADHQETLFMGLDQVRDLTRRVIKRIIEERPFTSLDDLMSRVMPSKKEASHLIQVGALDGFGAIPQLLKNLDDGSWEARQPALFQYTRDGDPEADWDASRRAQAQKEILGIALEKWAA
jgi:DNA polymerase III alpha subunit